MASETVTRSILSGCPDCKEEVPLNIREYWNFSEELTLNNGILFTNQRVVIPTCCIPRVHERRALTARAHSSHQVSRSKYSVSQRYGVLPSMSKDIQEAVEKFKVSLCRVPKQQQQRTYAVTVRSPADHGPHSRGTQRQLSENICSEDNLRSRIFGTFVVKFLACLPLLGFSNI